MSKHAAPEPVPTFGEMAVLLREWKESGVTLESLQWVATQQVWWDE